MTNELSVMEQTCKEVEPICEYSMIKHLVESLSEADNPLSSDTASLHSLAETLDKIGIEVDQKENNLMDVIEK